MTQPSPQQGPTSTPRGPQGGRADGPKTAAQLAQREAGLIAFIENMKAAEEEDEQDQRLFDGLTRQAAEEQPAHPAVAEGLGSMAAMYGAARRLSSTIYPAARQRHRDDYERGESPRKGSTRIEDRADAGRTHRDGAV